MVREAAGEAAYAAGHYAEALSDLRAAKRMNGVTAYLPMMADCHRALGQPEQALKLAKSPSVANFAPAAKAEMTIVEAGARRDMGQLDAALRTLELAPLSRSPATPGWCACATPTPTRSRRPAATTDALAWFHRTDAIDADELTDAAERAAELEKSPAPTAQRASTLDRERAPGVLGGPLQPVAVGDPDPVDLDHPGASPVTSARSRRRLRGGALGRPELGAEASGSVVTLTDPPWQTCGTIVTSRWRREDPHPGDVQRAVEVGGGAEDARRRPAGPPASTR